jgi:hypothetical protein
MLTMHANLMNRLSSEEKWLRTNEKGPNQGPGQGRLFTMK